ncbi:MAG: sigma-70 family RNA polymerase sigma factor [Rhodospirillaceae bacterium]|nr:MAG: sigma-70 family RNA polymerase sigma factor [Rhodospirillaceae bacterium]
MTDVFHDELIETLPALRAFAMMLTRDRAAGEDLLQDTVVRALDKWESFTPGTNLRAWLYTIMRNQHINGLRRRQRERLTDIDDDLLDNLDSVAANQEHSLVLKELMQAISGLRREQREALHLVVADGLSYEEVANICGCPVGTIRSRIARARQELEVRLTGEVLPKAHAIAAREAQREMVSAR